METSDDKRRSDRRRRHRLVFPERRTGFDRRQSTTNGLGARYQRMLLSYRDQPRTIFLVLVIFTVLNLADLVLTYRSLILGASEVNPVMKALFEVHPIWAGVVKMSVGMVVAIVIWVFRRYRPALVLSMGITLAMAALFVWHIFIGQNLPL